MHAARDYCKDKIGVGGMEVRRRWFHRVRERARLNSSTQTVTPVKRMHGKARRPIEVLYDRDYLIGHSRYAVEALCRGILYETGDKKMVSGMVKSSRLKMLW